MAGVKGRSGGARPGSGRKPKPKLPAADTPIAFLLSVMNDPNQDPRLRVRAAITAAQYEHTKKADGGKREELAKAAEEAARKFAPPSPPKLVVSNA